MKIALFIFRFGPSHGSILQTYALTRILESMGHKVTIIDRQRPITVYKRFMAFGAIVKRLLTMNFHFDEIRLTEFPKEVMSKLNIFIDKELRAQTKTVSREWELRKIGRKKYDAYIVGSDQTWRPKYVYNIYNYFLDFVPTIRNVKRLAYAASFGTSEWEYDEEQGCKCKQLVRLFNGVSVREDDGVGLCREHFGLEAQHVLDPTMLLKAEDYLRVIKRTAKQESFVGYNFLDFTDEKMRIVVKVSDALGIPQKQINSMTEKPGASLQERIAPSIDEWISGIANADFVIADSFHATVFSIIFHRPFITIANERRGLSRFTSLLKMLGLENRMVTNETQVDEKLIREIIDWEKIDEKMQERKIMSLRFLSSSLNNE